jgi:2-iminobutanoate/2-iminopropanoate deaminase
MKTISITDAPTPKGHYSQAVVHAGIVYVAGQLAADPKNPDAPAGDVGAQTRRIFDNIAHILHAADSGLDRVLQATIYLSDISAWGDVNQAFAEAFGEHRPARAVVPVGTLPRGLDVEITVTAAVR